MAGNLKHFIYDMAIMSPHADTQQNFRFFLVPLNFIHIEDLISTIAAQCENFIIFKARLIYIAIFFGLNGRLIS